MLFFSAETYGEPFTYNLIHDFNLRINILKAEITPGEEGHLLIDMEGSEDNVTRALEYLVKEQVTLVPINRQIQVDKELCIHCGACTAVCFSQAMTINRDTWQVEFDPDKCIICGLCVSACPLQIISGNDSQLESGKE
jgi:ferredoxin